MSEEINTDHILPIDNEHEDITDMHRIISTICRSKSMAMYFFSSVTQEMFEEQNNKLYRFAHELYLLDALSIENLLVYFSLKYKGATIGQYCFGHNYDDLHFVKSFIDCAVKESHCRQLIDKYFC